MSDCINNSVLCNDLDCEICFNKSFASIPFSTNLKNDDIDPRYILKNSNKFECFVCDNCGHDFDMAINRISKGIRCPFCSNSPKYLCFDDDCQLCFNKSFASILYNNNLKDKNVDPRHIFKNSNKKYEFVCDKCDHYFIMRICDIAKDRRCPFCANLKLCFDDDCQLCFDKSFASNPYSNNLKDKNIDPRQIF